MVTQWLWPGGIVVLQCSHACTVSRVLRQTTQVRPFRTLRALDPWTRCGPFPGKCPNCTVRCTHILTSTKVMYTHDFVNIFTDSRPVPGFLTMERCPIIWSPHQRHKHAHTRSSPRGHIPPKWSRQDFACAELQRILPHLRRRRSAESKIRSGQRGGTQRVATQPGAGS